MKRIVLCVEGDGEVAAMPLLIKKVLSANGLSSSVCVDEVQPFRLGNFFRLSANNFTLWKDKVQAAMMRKHAGGVLLVIDSDVLSDKRSAVACPIVAAKQLVAAAASVGACEVLQVPRTVDSLILNFLKGSQNVREAIVCVKAAASSAVYA